MTNRAEGAPEKIGFVGLGAMGFPMAANLVRKGFDVIGFDVDSDKIAKLVALGARAGQSKADTVAAVDVVITMLPATQHVVSAVLSEDGILAHMAPNAVLMDMSTIDPTGTDKVAAACARRNIAFTDCPVGRLVMHAERGESLFMVGGEDATFERVERLLLAMGNSIHRCGPVGMGSRMKVVNNYMLLVTAQVVSESIVLGTKLGLDIETMKTVTGSTTANNGQFQIALASKALKGDIEPGFTIDLAFKDLALAMAAAAENRVGLPVGAAAYSVFGAMRGTRFANKNYSSLLLYACELAGCESPLLG